MTEEMKKEQTAEEAVAEETTGTTADAAQETEAADTEEKTGIMIARHCLESLKSEEIVKWIEILKFLDDDRKKYVLRWQSSKEFVYK